MSEKSYWVYILICNNNNYYTGYTTNLERRFQEHLDGIASKYTRSFRPLAIAQSWQVQGTRSFAMKIERYIKKLTRSEKELLVHQPEALKTLMPL